MKIAKNTVPSITYTLMVDDEVVDMATKEEPLLFLFGAENLLPAFENQIDGKEIGDNFAFSLTAEQGYGEYNQDALVDLPVSVFEVNGEVQKDLMVVGNTIPMQDPEGNPLEGRIKEVTEESIKMDFNHPLAGKTLNFTGEIVGIREAEEEELAHGHAHGQGGHQH